MTKFTIELSTCVLWMDFLSKASEIWMSGKIQEAINTAGVNPGTLQEDKRFVQPIIQFYQYLVKNYTMA